MRYGNTIYINILEINKYNNLVDKITKRIKPIFSLFIIVVPFDFHWELIYNTLRIHTIMRNTQIHASIHTYTETMDKSSYRFPYPKYAYATETVQNKKWRNYK